MGTTVGNFVDSKGVGWRHLGDDVWETWPLGGRQYTRHQVEQMGGPLRPVVPMSAADKAALCHALVAAGNHAVGTLAAALSRLVDLRAPLISGAPDSPDSDTLAGFAAILGAQVAADSTRVDVASRASLLPILTRWTTDPDRFVEVAGNLAVVVSAVMDHHGGWSHVTDLPLVQRERPRRWLGQHQTRALWDQHHADDTYQLLDLLGGTSYRIRPAALPQPRGGAQAAIATDLFDLEVRALSTNRVWLVSTGQHVALRSGRLIVEEQEKAPATA